MAVASRQRSHHLVGPNGAGGGLHLGVARLRAAVGDVVPDGAGEEERLLRHHPQLAAERARGEAPHVDSVGQDGPARDVVEPGHQLQHGRFPRPGLAHERHRLAGLDGQVDPPQGLFTGAVAEADVDELEPAGQPAGVDRVGRRRRARRQGQQPLDPLDRDAGLLPGVEHRRQLLDGSEEQAEVEEEGDQLALGGGAPRHEHGPGAEDQGVGQLREHLDEGEVQGHEPLGVDPGPAVPVGQAGEAGLVALLTAVGLRHPHPGQVLLEVRVDLGHPVAGAVVGQVGALAVEPCGDGQRRHDGGGDEGQRGAHHDEGHGDAAAGDAADDGLDQAGRQQLLHGVDVGGHPGHHPATHLPVVVVEREALQVGEDLDPQRVKHLLGRRSGHQLLDDGVAPRGQGDQQG